MAWLVALAGCGRIGFDSLAPGDATGDAIVQGDALPDDAMIDASPLACEAQPCTATATTMMCGTRCFAFCRDRVLFSEARTRCEAWGGQLTSIRNATEQQCMSIVGSTGGWLGFTQSALATTPDTGWTWLDGSPFTYTAWFMNEPGDGTDMIENGQEQCGVAFGGGRWNDEDCTKTLAFLCAR